MRAFFVFALAAGMSACVQGECPEEEGLCRGQCVLEGGQRLDACGRGDRCITCPDLHLPDAVPVCNGSAPDGTALCGISCSVGTRGDCNHRPDDGCETHLDSDPENCGACGAICAGVCTEFGCIETLADGEVGASGLASDG